MKQTKKNAKKQQVFFLEREELSQSVYLPWKMEPSIVIAGKIYTGFLLKVVIVILG